MAVAERTEKSVLHDDVPLMLLRIYQRYQRVLNEPWLQRRAGKFDAHLFGRLVVAIRPEGDLYVVDGQHRLELARRAGLEAVPCELLGGLSLAEEARLFHDLDTQRRGLSTDDNFRALLVAEDPTALSIKEVLDRLGIGLGQAHNTKDVGFRAFGTAIALAHKLGIGAFEDALVVLHRAWPDNHRAITGQLLLGMAEFRRAFPQLDPLLIIDKLAANSTPEKLWAHAQALSGSLSTNTAGSVASAILAVWNLKRKSNRLKGKWLT